MTYKRRPISPNNAITEEMAGGLVNRGDEYETIEEAWQAAIALCHETDAYETNPVYEDEEWSNEN